MIKLEIEQKLIISMVNLLVSKCVLDAIFKEMNIEDEIDFNKYGIDMIGV